MIWVQHDLYKNFLKSFNVGDINLSLDIFRSELSDLLTNKTNDLFLLFEKVGIKHNKKQSYEELLDIILREMKVNEKFVRGLAFLIGESNEVNKNNPKISWVKLLDTIKRGIEQIATYFENNHRAEKLFRKKTLNMIELKSSIIGDDNRELTKKDNTVLWILGLAVVGVASYLIYRHYNRIDEARLRAESFGNKTAIIPIESSITSMESGGDLTVNETIAKESIKPINNDPSYNVSPEVLIPEANIPQMQNPNAGSINIQVQPMSVPQQNVSNVQQNSVNI